MSNPFLHKLLRVLKAWQQDQRGAVALLMLASILITFMLALVVHDVGFMAEDKLEVQIAADTASWSQSAVEARAMNIIAFANVGKRVTVGMVSYYEGLWIGLASITAIVVLATIACWIIAAIPFAQGIIPWCIKLTSTSGELLWLIADELPDLVSSGGLGDLLNHDSGYFHKDVEGFTKYQQYMYDIAPFWSWGENFTRGFRNGAVTSGWPVPPADSSASNALSGFLSNVGVPDGTGIKDALPVVPNTGIDKEIAYDSMCKRVYGGSSSDASNSQNGGNNTSQFLTDTVAHTLDYTLKTIDGGNATEDNVPGGLFRGERAAALAAMLLMNFGLVKAGCEYSIKEEDGLMGVFNDIPGNPIRMPVPFGQNAWPFTIMDDNSGLGGQVGWLRMSSNLTIAYRRGVTRNDAKYDMFTDDGITLGIAERLQGVWALSRSEITYQNASSGNSVSPDLWHSSWTARMRPVSLPGEWSGVQMSKAYRDVAPWMIRGLAVDALVGQGIDLDTAVDGLRMGLGTMEMNDNMDGVAK